MIWPNRIAVCVCVAFASCGENAPTKEDLTSVQITARLPDDAIVQDSDAPITKDVVDKVARLMELTANGQLGPLIREAERNENFQSNFGDQTHRRHWFLLRRVGIDPVQSLRDTLNEPYAAKRVGNETWFIWPDFAARAPDELIPETLSFQDRARLRDLVGEEGIERIRGGEPYPGVRLAISETGRWVYFIHDIDAAEDN